MAGVDSDRGLTVTLTDRLGSVCTAGTCAPVAHHQARERRLVLSRAPTYRSISSTGDEGSFCWMCSRGAGVPSRGKVDSPDVMRTEFSGPSQ